MQFVFALKEMEKLWQLGRQKVKYLLTKLTQTVCGSGYSSSFEQFQLTKQLALQEVLNQLYSWNSVKDT